ncbi:MAG: sulfatase [Puniceicoccales bacterium]|jgi:arylsulfatase A-like enzyme|nr:sulfatase [Puniceicoccales bacterium]
MRTQLAAFITATSLAAPAIVSAAEPVSSGKSARPNIVFIFSDDHAAQSIQAYGAKLGVSVTPNIDRMAREGMTFENCFAGNPLCGPSRASLLTGKFSHANKFFSNEAHVPFDGSQPTFPKYLKEAGYQSAIFGKWHLESTPTGFDDYAIMVGQGIYYNSPVITPKGKKERTGYVTEAVTQDALNWLKDKRDAKKPFVLMVHHKAPHRNWVPGPNELDLFKGHVWPEPPTLRDTYEGKAQCISDIRMRILRDMPYPSDLLIPAKGKDTSPGYMTGMWYLSKEERKRLEDAYREENDLFIKNNPQGDALLSWKYQRYMTNYLRTVAGVDKSVGTILDYLKKSGLEENTLVIYSSDQGFFLGEHGWYDKRMPYDESGRMPFIARWPGKVKAGSRTPTVIQNTDIAPTFMDLAGVPVLADIHGRSVVPLLQGKADPANRDEAYFHFYEDTGEHHCPVYVAVRTQDHLLAWYYEHDYTELFDIKKDPLQLKNEADNPAFAETRKSMEKRLRQLAEKYGDRTAPWGDEPGPKLKVASGKESGM